MLTYRRFADWGKILSLPAPDPAYPFITAIWHFVRGSAFVATDDLVNAESELAALKAVSATDEMQDHKTWVNSGGTLLTIASYLLASELATRREDFLLALFHHEVSLTLLPD